jgi:hypothetical protein
MLQTVHVQWLSWLTPRCKTTDARCQSCMSSLCAPSVSQKKQLINLATAVCLPSGSKIHIIPIAGFVTGPDQVRTYRSAHCTHRQISAQYTQTDQLTVRTDRPASNMHTHTHQLTVGTDRSAGSLTLHDHLNCSIRLSSHHPSSIPMSPEAHLCETCRAQVQLPVLQVLD